MSVYCYWFFSSFSSRFSLLPQKHCQSLTRVVKVGSTSTALCYPLVWIYFYLEWSCPMHKNTKLAPALTRRASCYSIRFFDSYAYSFQICIPISFINGIGHVGWFLILRMSSAKAPVKITMRCGCKTVFFLWC